MGLRASTPRGRDGVCNERRVPICWATGGPGCRVHTRTQDRVSYFHHDETLNHRTAALPNGAEFTLTSWSRRVSGSPDEDYPAERSCRSTPGREGLRHAIAPWLAPAGTRMRKT